VFAPAADAAGGPLPSAADAAGLKARASAARAAAGQVAGDPAVRKVFENRALPKNKKGFAPNDPLFPSAPGYPGQWYLVNTFTAGLDAGVAGAWTAGLTGQGVVIGIVDDGVQTTHPDLAANIDISNSFDFLTGSVDPNPKSAADDHGTPVAGLAAARGGNGIGITGAAPLASIAGLRFGTGTGSDYQAITYRSVAPTALIAVKNHSYGSDVLFGPTTENDALAVSAGSGTVHCWAAGNERSRSPDQDVNKEAPLNSPDAIIVGAVGSGGRFADYSSWGANLACVAPASTAGGFSMASTDLTGSLGLNTRLQPGESADLDYTFSFGGTSGSTAVASGVMALVRQFRPNMDVRFAKHLLARTCTLVDPFDATPTSDGGWRTNAAGIRFNQNYGFGLINAGAMATLAASNLGVTRRSVVSTGRVTVGQGIPDKDAAGIFQTFAVASRTPLEEVSITLDITHPFRGDLEVYLTSPSGTTSRLMSADPADSGDDLSGWTLTSLAFWGESPAGTWTIRVSDRSSFDQGTWNWFSATLNTGALVPAPIPGSPAVPRYRLYLDLTQEHLFTTDPNEYATLPAFGWVPEGVAHQVFRSADADPSGGLVPMYRLYDRPNRRHFWTTDANEYAVLRGITTIFNDESVDSYIYADQRPGTVPLYRLVFGGTINHHWTTDANEYATLATLGWVQEGVIGYVLP
jgi:subtilisin-like proprotein convertase family protein